MKHCLFFLLIGLILSVSSCKDPDGIDMIYTDFFQIQSGANTIETHYFQSGLLSSNWENFLGDLQLEDIENIRPSFARMYNNEGVELDFISRVVIEIYPDEDTTPTPWEMAFREDIPFNTGTQLEIIPGQADFKDELADGQFIYRIGLRYRQFPPTNVNVILDFGFLAVPNN